jgi:hypothetical protein
MTITVYTPSDEESNRLLANVEKWVQVLRKQNVAADIAAYIARDFLSPMRIKPLDGDGVQSHDCTLPKEETAAVNGSIYYPQDED